MSAARAAKDRRLGPIRVPDRDHKAVDVLRCERGPGHDVRMESVPVNGIQYGRLRAFCWTCQRVVPPGAAPPPPTATDLRERRQTARLTQVMRREDAQARREFIRNAVAKGQKRIDIARQLGITNQRVSQILSGRVRRSA